MDEKLKQEIKDLIFGEWKTEFRAMMKQIFIEAWTENKNEYYPPL